MKSKLLLIYLLLLSTCTVHAATLQGMVTENGAPLAYVDVLLNESSLHTQSDKEGRFRFSDIEKGSYSITISMLGYSSIELDVEVEKDDQNLVLEFEMEETSYEMDDIVVTGTKTFKRKTDSPVIVNIISSQTMEDVQACNISESLKFQPGLRVESNCQTCNYTQLRMNGLAGGYSQILINGRPIFSPLTGLYGLEQLPVNMVDKIEVVRGGGSSLYGSSAIGGTVNILTKIPTENTYSASYNLQSINGQALDHITNANASLVTRNKNNGVSIFFTARDREIYDHNGDNFSELPALKNRSFGANFFSRPTDNQKFEFSISKLNEYRYGGEIGVQPAHLAEQSEERDHDVWMSSLDYQLNFNEDRSSLIVYAAGQNTQRDHYTGIQPDGADELASFIENPPYGNSEVVTYNAGIQLNHKVEDFIVGTNVFTFGAEYIYDKVYDEIEAYNYLIDQTTKNAGTFVQSDWEFTKRVSLLSGLRVDKHNFVEGIAVSPRISLLLKPLETTQIRLNYAKGFRAPQAFDADLHIAFAGGGISRIMLSPDLEQENSHSISTSINYDKVQEDYVFGYTLEGFYTRLNDAFVLESLGEDEFGERFMKTNGQGATVQGLTLELRANYNRKAQLEAGYTLQSSLYDEEVTYIEGIAGSRQFTRTPNQYGFATFSFTPNAAFSANLNYVYTGSMLVPHFAGAPNQLQDEIFTSPSFSELSVKIAYDFKVKFMQSKLQVFSGVKNMFNAYQGAFDVGKNRDSNFVYGPSLPRTFYVGVKVKNL